MKFKSLKLKLIFSILIFVMIIPCFYTGISADNTWETVCSSDDFANTDFFADDFDVTQDGTIYCVDTSSGTIIGFSNGEVDTLFEDSAPGYSSICVSNDDKTLYILGSTDNSITKFFVETNLSEYININSISAASLDYITVSPNNDIYITDYLGNCIHIVHPNGSSEVLYDSGGAGLFSGPLDIDINSSSKLAIVSTFRNQVIFIGQYYDTFSATNTTPENVEGGNITGLIFTAIDDENNIYLVDNADNRVVMFRQKKGIYKTLYPVNNANEFIAGICAQGNYLYLCIGKLDYSGFRIIRSAVNNNLIEFSFEGIDAQAQINNNNNTVSFTVPYETDLSSLIPNITVSQGAISSIPSGTPYDFSSPVVLSIESGVLGKLEYNVTITKDEPIATPTPETDEEITDETDNENTNTQENENTTNNEGTTAANYITDSSDSLEWSDDLLPDNTNRILAIIIIAAYFIVLILWIVLIIVLSKSKKHKIFIILLIIWLIAGAVLVVYSRKQVEDISYPIYIENADYETEDYEKYELSKDQQDITDDFGSPDGFLILFEDNMRQETWFYYEERLVIDFIDGIEIQRGYDNELSSYDINETDYDPCSFVYDITPGTVLDENDIHTFIMEPLDDELIEDGVLYYAEGIVMGFVDEKLVYVETILSED